MSAQSMCSVTEALGHMPGFEVDVRPDMDAWLKYHVALLMPALALAFYGCGSDRLRLAGTRGAVALARVARRGQGRGGAGRRPGALRPMGVAVNPARSHW